MFTNFSLKILQEHYNQLPNALIQTILEFLIASIENSNTLATQIHQQVSVHAFINAKLLTKSGLNVAILSLTVINYSMLDTISRIL